MKLKLLLADDDQDDRLFFHDAVLSTGKEVDLHWVTDGEQLIRFLQTADTLPHLIFMDLNMPRKNGKECLTEIRSQKRFDGIQIAVYTTTGEDKEIQNLESLGANIFIRKPNDFHLLCKLISELLHSFQINQFTPFRRYIQS